MLWLFGPSGALLAVLLLAMFISPVGTSAFVYGLLNRSAPPDARPEGERPPAHLEGSVARLDGDPEPLASLLGQRVFVNVWATWCGPCVAEMPHIAAMREAVGDDVRVVLISLDDDPAKARDLLDRRGLEALAPDVRMGQMSDFPFLLPPSDKPGFSISVPMTTVIDPQGRIALRVGGISQWDDPDFVDWLRAL